MQPLADLVVVELATGIAGPYAGKLFADYGADVLKVEPPDGDPSRSEGSREGERPEPESSPLFTHLNANKRSIVLDLESPEAPDSATLDELLATADLVIESRHPSEPPSDTLDPEAIRARHPHLVVTSVTPFGRTGPYAAWHGGEIVAYAMGGPMNATGAPEREPIKLAGNIVQYQCGAVAAVASLGAVLEAATSREGSHVDVANFETQAASIDRRMALTMGQIFMGHNGQREGGNRIGVVPAGVYPTADGYCQIVFAPNWMPRVAAMLDHDELSQRLASPDWMDDLEVPEILAEAIFTWTVQRTKQEAMEDAQASQLAVMPLNETTDVLDDAHLAQRDYWNRYEHESLGVVTAPGPQIRMADGWDHRRAAPRLGQHNSEIRSTTRRPRPQSRGATDRRLPLEGLRVLDLTVVWAGPLTTMLLGDLGAEVIRLDNPNLFPTATRGAIPRPREGHVRDLGQYWGVFPNGEAGERPWNRVGAFVIHARGKRSATVDLRTDLGRETFYRLVEQSDVFVENNSAKVLAQLGLDHEELRRRNPRLITLRMPSLGLDGPYRDYIGFGAHMEALCGLSSLRGYRDLDPSALDATYFMDPASGAAGAFAVMAALRRRETTGVGELIELAQAENLLNYVGEYIIDASVTGRPHERHGNRHPHRAPQGCYPTEGDDNWIVISVADDEAWKRLVLQMGSPSWAGGDLDREAARRERHDEIDEWIAQWTAGYAAMELATQLQMHGIEAAPVMNEHDLVNDPHLAQRGFFRPNSSVDVPESKFSGHLWRWDGPDLTWGPLNVMGADNDYVYRDVLDLTDDEMAQLEADGHLGDGYRGPDGSPL